MSTRRNFLKTAALAGGGALFFHTTTGMVRMPVAAALVSPQVTTKFTSLIRTVSALDPTGIPVAVPDGQVTYAAKNAKKSVTATHYSMDIREFTDGINPLFGPDSTTLWGFSPKNTLVPSGPTGQIKPKHLGGIIIAKQGQPIQITFTNLLKDKNGKGLQHILPVDTSLMGAEPGQGQNRTTVHFHGGYIPWISDGGPFTWFDHAGAYGPGVILADGTNIYDILQPPDGRKRQKGQAEYYYPMQQSARFGWYHDHAVGITRLNAHAGIASGLIIRDDFEASLVKNGLPDYIEKGGREVPIVIQDKKFLGVDDPNYPGRVKSQGSLWYPYEYDVELPTNPGPAFPLPSPVSALPEFFGDTMLVNGTAYPRLPVAPRRYRLRLLNACQGRFLNLQLYEEYQGTGLPDFSKPGPDFLIIGTEGGFLSQPVSVPMGKRLIFDPKAPADSRVVLDPARPGGSLLTGPAERWDILVDFNGLAGKKYILYNDAPAPYPMGGIENDGPAVLAPGVNSGEFVYTNQCILRIEVDAEKGQSKDSPLDFSNVKWFKNIDPSLVKQGNGPGGWPAGPKDPVAAPKKVTVRQLTLNEIFDEFGRLIQMLGTDQLLNPPEYFTLPAGPDGPRKTYAMQYMDRATEVMNAGDTEVWKIANLTADVHPMHFHLVNVQVLSRQSLVRDKVTGYPKFNADGTFAVSGELRGPDPTELGWKETVKMNPDEVTTVIMNFSLPPVPFEVPPSPRSADLGATGNEYVWHCHILEHEEHDMMRPIVVQGKNPKSDGF